MNPPTAPAAAAPSPPSVRIPASARPQAIRVCAPTRVPPASAMHGVRTTLSCRKNASRVAVVSANPAFDRPCDAKFQNASSPATRQNVDGACVGASLGGRTTTGAKHAAVTTCRTKLSAAGVGGPGRP